jgi:hypothetical protein
MAAPSAPGSRNFPTDQNNPNMKKTHKALTLGEMILAVSAHSRNNRETMAAVADLLGSGRVRLQAGRRSVRARVF